MTATLREQYLSLLYTGPLLKSDAIVLLSGDGETRISPALQCFFTGGAVVIVTTGKKHEPPFSLDAHDLKSKLMGEGLSHERIVVSPTGTNTREEADGVVALAIEREWKLLSLCTSTYHMPRALLSFIAALEAREKAEAIRVVPVPSNAFPKTGAGWFGVPEGESRTRFELLSEEFGKIEKYRERGHVASYERGVEYFKGWEGR